MKTDKLLHLLQQKKFMRSGGALPLPKAQKGIPTDQYTRDYPPIYVTDPNDPRLKSYNDSLALYKNYKKPPLGYIPISQSNSVAAKDFKQSYSRRKEDTKGFYYSPNGSSSGNEAIVYYGVPPKKPVQPVELNKVKHPLTQGGYDPMPIFDLMMPDGNRMKKDDFINIYGEAAWLKATRQKFQTGGGLSDQLFQKYYGQVAATDRDKDGNDLQGYDYFYSQVPELQALNPTDRSILIDRLMNFMQHPLNPNVAVNPNELNYSNLYTTPQEIDKSIRQDNYKLKLNKNLTPKQPVVYDEYQTGGLAKAQKGIPNPFMPGKTLATGAIEKTMSPIDVAIAAISGVGLVPSAIKLTKSIANSGAESHQIPWLQSMAAISQAQIANTIRDTYEKINDKKVGGLAKAQEGLQFVPNGTYGNYYDPSTGQYIPQVYLPDLNIEADRELPLQNGKFAPFLASRGVAEYVPLEAALLPGTPIIKGLGKVGNFALDALNPLAGMNVGKGFKIPKSQWEQIPLDDVRWKYEFNYDPKLFGNYKPSDFEKQIKREASEYLELTKDPRYLERVRALDAEAKAAGLESNLQLKLRRFWEQGDKPENLVLSQDKYLPFNIETAQSIPYINEYGNSKDALGLSTLSSEGFKKWVMRGSQGMRGKNFFPNFRKITINEPRHLTENVPVRGTVHHELKHHWTDALENEPYYSDLLQKSVIPADANDVIPRKDFKYYTDETEIDAHLMTNMRDEMVKKGVLKDHFDELTKEKLSTFIKENPEYRGTKEYFKPGEEIVWDRSNFINAFNKGLPAVALPIGISMMQNQEKQIGGSIMNSYQKGGGIKDMVVSEIWEKVTGTKWSQAKKLGLSDGSYDTNIKLRQMLINEAMQPKPNFGKFVGKTSYVVPASSAMVNQLRQEGLAQANVQKDNTKVARLTMPPVVGRVAPKAPSKSVPLPKVEIPTNQTAPAGTSAVSRPPMAPVVGRAQSPAPRSVAMQPVVMPTNATASASTTAVRQPVMSPVVGRATAKAPVAPTPNEPSQINNALAALQAMQLMGNSAVQTGMNGIYNATIGPEIEYFNDPNSAVAANTVRGALGAVGIPLNAANIAGDLVGVGKKMDNRSLNDEQKRILYRAAQNAQNRNSSVIGYEDYAGLGHGDDKLFTQDLKRGNMSNKTMLVESATNPAFNIAGTIGQNPFEFTPNGELILKSSSDWNPEDPTFSNDDTWYRKIRNYMRLLNREQIKGKSPEELKEMEQRNAININIPKSILTEKKKGGSTGLRIKIRKS